MSYAFLVVIGSFPGLSEQGNFWNYAQVEVRKNIQAFRIRATTGYSGPQGDIAIDDVQVESLIILNFQLDRWKTFFRYSVAVAIFKTHLLLRPIDVPNGMKYFLDLDLGNNHFLNVLLLSCYCVLFHSRKSKGTF